jgi:Flp pilus assembly pilin Flp
MQEFVTLYPDARYDEASRVVARVRAGPSLGSDIPFLIDHSNQGWQEKTTMLKVLARKLWNEQEGQDIAEYAVMLAVILVIVVGTIRLIGSNANNVFSNVASSIQ